MRAGIFAVATSLACLAACGGPETSQANNAQANISNDATPQNTAEPSAVTPASFAPVHGADAHQIMHERHEGMEAIGKANKAIKRELDGGSPDLRLVRSNASKIEALSHKASGWFPAGTGPDVGKTGAKPEIWHNQQDFLAKLRDFQKAAQTFNSAAAGNDPNGIKTAFGDLGKACKACHDKYRTEMKH
jgi:cytochrome c556